MGRASCPGGQRGSVIHSSHSLPPPSLAPQPGRAITRRSSEIYSELALGSWRPHPAWSRGVLCGQDEQTLWLPVLSCLQQGFGYILSLPGTPSHQNEGEG